MAVNASAFVDNVISEARLLGEALTEDMNKLADQTEKQLFDMLKQIEDRNKAFETDLDNFSRVLNANMRPVWDNLFALERWEAYHITEGVESLRENTIAKREDKAKILAAEIARFTEEHFPIKGAALKAYSTAVEMIEGKILVPAVENAIWQRDRDRLLIDGRRSRGDFLATFAARGFPLPPGVATHALYLFDADMNSKIAQQSRDVAIKQAETLMENFKSGVDKLVQIQQAGVSMVGDYLKSYLLLVNSEQDLEKFWVDKAFQVWELKKQIIDTRIGVEETYNEQWLKFQASKTDVAVRMSDLEQRGRQDVAQTFQRQMEALGNMASSAYNAIHASASVSAVGETD